LYYSIGDVIDAFMAVMVLRTCEQVEGGLPADIKSKMYVNIMLDFGIGLVPFLGDIADALFRANTRNAVVLEKFLRAKGAKNLKAQGHRVPTIDPSDPDEFDRFEEHEVNGPPPPYTNPPTRQGTQRIDNSHGRSTQQQVPEESRGGWFSGFGSKKKQPDVERGTDLRRREDEPLPSLPNDGPRRDKSTLQKTRR
jgi:hypothetical protein